MSTKMAIKLYMVWGSPVVNAVLMTAKILNIDLEIVQVDFSKEEYTSEWFLKLNPSHTVPTIDDNGVIIWDSHVILQYLVEKYGQHSNMFPADEKYQILQILYLNCGTIFRRMSDCCKPIFYENANSINPKHIESMKDAYLSLNRLLEDRPYFAGETLTIADISIFATLLITNVFIPVQKDVPNLKTWFDNLRGMEFYKVAEKGVNAFEIGLQEKLTSG